MRLDYKKRYNLIPDVDQVSNWWEAICFMEDHGVLKEPVKEVSGWSNKKYDNSKIKTSFEEITQTVYKK